MRCEFGAVVLLGLAIAGPLQGQMPAAGSAPVLESGDVLKIEIWREEDLSGDFMVDETGNVTLPLLGPRHVRGLTLSAVRDTLLAAYRVELRNPSISITPHRRVYILGEVNEPGLYGVDPTLSLAGAIAMAGGANPQGDLNKIRVIRQGEVILRGVKAEAALAAADIRSGDQIFVDRHGWFERNSPFILSSSIGIVGIIITLLR